MKIPALDTSAQRFLSGLRNLDRVREQAHRQVASGLRVERPSDAPDTVSRLLEIRAGLARLDQNLQNLRTAEVDTQAAEGALQNAAKLMDRVRALGAQGASALASPEIRQGLAGEIEDLLQRLVALANTQSMGRFVFSGNQDQQAAYAWNPTSDPPWGPYQGTPANRQLEHPTGSRMDLARDAQSIFDYPADSARSVFQQVRELRDALRSGGDARILAAQGPLAGATAHLNAALSFYGNVQARLAEARDTASQMKLRLEQSRSEFEDADLAESIVRMQQAALQREAALQLRGQQPRRTLFDYLR